MLSTIQALVLLLPLLLLFLIVVITIRFWKAQGIMGGVAWVNQA